MIRDEIASQLAPLRDALDVLRDRATDLQALGAVAKQLSPLAAMLGFAAPPATNAVRVLDAGRLGRPRGRVGRPPRGEATSRACAIRGCGRPARTKGYCSAHYQKLRMLARTNRRPSSWVDFASANSVEDIVLPRGRAAAKARRAQQG